MKARVSAYSTILAQLICFIRIVATAESTVAVKLP